MFVRPCIVRTTKYATKKMQQIPFIDLFKSALRVSGDKLARPQEQFLTVYTAFGIIHRYCYRQAAISAATLEGGSCTVPEAVVTVLCTGDDGCG